MGERDEPIQIVTALVRVAFLVNAAYAESGRHFGLTPQQGQLLCLLRPKAYGMGELCAKLGLAKSTTTGLIDILERDGLVKRKPGADARAVDVALTGRGRKSADRFYDATRQRIEAVLEPLAEEEREEVAAFLGRVVQRDDVSMIFMG